MNRSVTGMDLESDDIKMSEWAQRLQNELRVCEEDCHHLATAICRDILASDLSHFTNDDVLSHAERFNELAVFLNGVAEARHLAFSPLLNRAMLTLSNYMCFVYLGDVCFTRLRKALPRGTTAFRCCKYLTENPVRAFRNAIAHGNWRVTDRTITYWARKGEDPNETMSEFTLVDDDREFWFFLAACTGKSAFAALTTAHPAAANERGVM